MSDFVNAHKFADYGINGEAGRGVDLKFRRDVASVCHNGIDRYVDFSSDFFIGKSLDYAFYDFFFYSGCKL